MTVMRSLATRPARSDAPRVPTGVQGAPPAGPVEASVIVPCRDAAATLGATLESLARQRWDGAWEVIVVDDGSRDDSAAVAERFRGRLPHLRVVRQPPRGVSAARNAGARLARGTALIFCDADDEAGEGWLAGLARQLREHPVVGSRWEVERLNPDGEPSGRAAEQTRSVQHYRYPDYLPHVGACGLAVRRELHERIGGFDESLARLEDTDYAWRLQLAGAELHLADDAYVHVRFRPGTWASMRQSYLYGHYDVLLYKRYRAQGMPPLCLKASLRSWGRLLGNAPAALLRRERRVGWLRSLARRVGRLTGSLRFRVMGL